jgi:hypothetical protein
MKYNNLTLGKIEAIANKLGGEEGIELFLSGKTIVIPVEKKFKYLEVWKKVTLGVDNASIFILKLAMESFPIVVSTDANWMLYESNIKLERNQKDLNLFLVTPEDLDYEENEVIFYDDFCLRAWSRYGLRVCPAEVGPKFAMQHGDSFEGGWIHIAMKPISNPKIHNPPKYIFRIYPSKGRKRQLEGYNKDGLIYRQDKFIFCREE